VVCTSLACIPGGQVGGTQDNLSANPLVARDSPEHWWFLPALSCGGWVVLAATALGWIAEGEFTA
jgi:hypothetical protein